MSLPHFLLRLNWKQILLHTVACILMAYSFTLFSFMHDFSFVRDVHNILNNKHHRLFDISRVSVDLLFIQISKPFGLLTGSFISIVVAIRKRLFWVNTLIVFVISILLLRYHISHYLLIIFLKPGSIFSDNSIWYYIINGTVLFALSLLIFFLKISIDFIAPKPIIENESGLISKL